MCRRGSMTVLERKPPSHSTFSTTKSLTPERALELIESVNQPLWLSHAASGEFQLADPGDDQSAYAPACHPSMFGDQVFRTWHGLRFNYVAGAMANGIAS